MLCSRVSIFIIRILGVFLAQKRFIKIGHFFNAISSIFFNASVESVGLCSLLFLNSWPGEEERRKWGEEEMRRGGEEERRRECEVWGAELKFMQMIVSGGLEGGVKGNESPLQGAD